jgi:deoxyadenosine/deoxycytidine kinase
MNKSNFVLLSLEGNIGSGKSTVLQILKERHPDWIFVDEPVGDWLALRNEHGESLLEVFYKDKKRWSYTFQNAAVLYRFKKLRGALDSLSPGSPAVIVMERSLETDRQIFCRMLHRDGFVDSLEKRLYEDWFTHITGMVPEVDGYIFINTDPKMSFERVAKRAREGESVIPLAYLEELDTYHRNWLFGERNDKPVLDFTNTKSDIATESVVSFIQDLQTMKI